MDGFIWREDGSQSISTGLFWPFVVIHSLTLVKFFDTMLKQRKSVWRKSQETQEGEIQCKLEAFPQGEASFFIRANQKDILLSIKDILIKSLFIVILHIGHSVSYKLGKCPLSPVTSCTFLWLCYSAGISPRSGLSVKSGNRIKIPRLNNAHLRERLSLTRG